MTPILLIADEVVAARALLAFSFFAIARSRAACSAGDAAEEARKGAREHLAHGAGHVDALREREKQKQISPSESRRLFLSFSSSMCFFALRRKRKTSTSSLFFKCREPKEEPYAHPRVSNYWLFPSLHGFFKDRPEEREASKGSKNGAGGPFLKRRRWLGFRFLVFSLALRVCWGKKDAFFLFPQSPSLSL